MEGAADLAVRHAQEVERWIERGEYRLFDGGKAAPIRVGDDHDAEVVAHPPRDSSVARRVEAVPASRSSSGRMSTAVNAWRRVNDPTLPWRWLPPMRSRSVVIRWLWERVEWPRSVRHRSTVARAPRTARRGRGGPRRRTPRVEARLVHGAGRLGKVAAGSALLASASWSTSAGTIADVSSMFTPEFRPREGCRRCCATRR